MKMYYLKLATGPIITLSAQALASTSTTTATTATTSTTTTTASTSSASTKTTTTTSSKPTATFVLKSPGSNLSKPVTSGSGSKLKSQVPVVTSSPAQIKAQHKRRNVSPTSVPSPIADTSVLKIETSLSPGSSLNSSGLGGSNSGGTAAAARLIDLGKQLLEATREGKVETVRQLIVGSGAPFTSDWLGTTALHIAAQNGSVEIAEILLNGGVNRDAKTKLDRTALHMAAQSGSVEIVDMLISNGTDINARDMLKMTPLHWAVERGHVSVVMRLLVAGSDLNIKNKFQLTPIDIAKNSECYSVIKAINNWTGIGGGGSSAGSGRVASGQTSLASRNANDNNPTFGHQPQTPSSSLNYSNQDLNQLFDFGVSGFSSDESPLMTQIMTANSKTNMYRNHEQMHSCAHNALGSIRMPTNESHDLMDFDHHLALIDCANGLVEPNTRSCNSGGGGGSNCGPMPSATRVAGSNGDSPPEEKCIDLVEFEWNNLDFAPELFMPTNDSDDGESNVEYLMKIVEELQKENRQLRQQVEQLSTP